MQSCHNGSGRMMSPPRASENRRAAAAGGGEEERQPPPTAATIELVQAGPDDLDLMCDLVDCSLRGDAFIPRGQMRGILGRATSTVWLIVLDDVVAGFAIVYNGGVLHNLHVQDWARKNGVGSRVVAALKPQIIRSKSNMRAGDPTPFYARQGYVTESTDAKRPHINVMVPAADLPPQKRAPLSEQMRRFVFADDAAAVTPSLTEQSGEDEVRISKTEYEKMRKELEKYTLRKAKQATYQKIRAMRKVNSVQENISTV